VSPTTVGKERAKLEQDGDVSNLDTRIDTKGRKQPATKSKLTIVKSDRKARGKPSRPTGTATESTPDYEPGVSPRAPELTAKTQRDTLSPELRQLVKLLKTVKRDVAFLTDPDLKHLNEAQVLFAGIVKEYIKLGPARAKGEAWAS
jgi:hypothetical protein